MGSISAVRATQLIACAVFLCLGLTEAEKRMKICMPAVKCMTRDIEYALLNNKMQELCDKLPKFITCVEDAKVQCGGVDSRFEKTLDTVKKSHEQCTGEEEPHVGRVKKPSDGQTAEEKREQCMNEMKKCLTPELLTAQQENDAEMICKVGPESIACMDRWQTRCSSGDEEEMNFIGRLKQSVEERCVQIADGVWEPKKNMTCGAEKDICLGFDESFENAEDGDNKCRLAETVLECLTRWQVRCSESMEENDTEKIEEAKKSVGEQCNSAGALRVSISLMAACFVVLLKRLISSS